MTRLRLIALTCLLVLPTLAHAQASVVAAPPGKRQFFTTTNSAGIPLAGGKIYFCSSGSSCPGTPLASYSDSTGNTLNANPIILDAAGMVPGSADVYLLSGSAYKIVAQNSLGATQWTLDNVRANDALSLANTYSQTQTFNGLAVFNGGIGGARILFQQFTASGTFTIPANVTAVKVTVLGPGGAGGGSTAANSGASGGAGGAAFKYLSGLTPGNTITVTVGAGGTGVSGASGNTGTASSISSGTQTITTVTGNSGTGGGTGAGTQFGGTGGSATSGDLNFTGNSGNPNLSGSATTGVSGAGSIFGGGGQNAFQGPGNPGTAPGAGGSGTGSNGAGNLAGGAGANGIVIFEYVN